MKSLFSGGVESSGSTTPWSIYTLICVSSNAFGGICTGMVVKHAGGVRKSFAIISGLVLSGVLRWVYRSGEANYLLLIFIMIALSNIIMAFIAVIVNLTSLLLLLLLLLRSSSLPFGFRCL